ncbi:acyl-CoA thioesterase [Dactylosporangium sp. NPDC005572]|uniref:acyl-CoA thioesterase n=1 Tax=Dactylosporangium sp. NPDC005572 TaxID=3156889 RepID=UPI0033B71558
MTEVFQHPLRVRYMEVDIQGVVFNAWYLAYFDDAFPAFLAHRGLVYSNLLAAGFDTQVVHSEIDWRAGLHWQDDVLVAVSTARLGRTSFAVDFETRRGGTEITCSARLVYVVVAIDKSGKREIPRMLADALGTPAPLRTD